MTAFQIRDDATSLELFDAAEARQTAARDALRLLAGAPDLGSPGSGMLSSALGGVELLLGEAALLYSSARARR